MNAQYTIVELVKNARENHMFLTAVASLAERGFDRKAIAEGASVNRDGLNRAVAGSRKPSAELADKVTRFAAKNSGAPVVELEEGKEADASIALAVRATKHLNFLEKLSEIEGQRSSKNKFTRRQIALDLNVTPAFMCKLIADQAPVPARVQELLNDYVDKAKVEIAAHPYVEKVAKKSEEVAEAPAKKSKKA